MAKITLPEFWLKTKLFFSFCLLTSLVIPQGVFAYDTNDLFYSNQWYLKRIDAPNAWDIARDAPEVIVAIIDTGVDIKHPDLVNNIWTNEQEIPGNKKDDDKDGYIDDVNGWDFVNNTADPGPKFKTGFTEEGINHGTIVAGVLAAQGSNGIGISGVAQSLKIMPLKALDDAGKTQSDKIIKAINFAIDHKANIINLSFVGAKSSPSLDQAIRRAYDKDIIIVAAGGNDLSRGAGQFLDRQPQYPVCSDGRTGENLIVGVAGSGPLDTKATFSGYGKCIDITAPAVSIFSTAVFNPQKGNNKLFQDSYDGYWSGTSFAVPQVSATLALMMQINPSLRAKELINLLKASADNINSVNPNFIGKLGAGRLDVTSSLLAAQAAKEREKSSILLFNDSEILGQIKQVTAKGVVKTKFQTFTNTKINVATGDFNGDGQTEIAVTPQNKAISEVRIYQLNGKLITKFLAFESKFTSGVNLASGDIDGNGLDELVMAPTNNRQSEIKIMNKNFKLRTSWLAYGATYLGGTNLSVADLNQDGKAEIVTAPASNSSAQIKIFNGNGKLISQWLAYEPFIKSGFKITAINPYSSFGSNPIIAVAAGKGMLPYVKVFTPDGRLINNFLAYEEDFNKGVNITSSDINNDGRPEIITGTSLGEAPLLSLFEQDGTLIKSYYSDKKTLTLGVDVATYIYK
jgi:hypothetical protein